MAWGAARLHWAIPAPSFSQLVGYFCKVGLHRMHLPGVTASGAFSVSSRVASGTSCTYESEPQGAIAHLWPKSHRTGPEVCWRGWCRRWDGVWSRKAESGSVVQKFMGKLEQLLVHNKHTCGRVCSSVKGGLEKEASVHAMNLKLVFPTFLPFFQHILWFSFLSLWGRGGKALIIYKC